MLAPFVRNKKYKMDSSHASVIEILIFVLNYLAAQPPSLYQTGTIEKCYLV